MKLKYFRVARSGRTIDGREITPEQIDQMAANYDPKKYGARIWLEHLRSTMPDGTFKAYGDVLAVKTETDADGARVLLAQIDATEDLMKLSAARQKVFFSIEIQPNFAGTGEAYLAGLAVTDSPASLGTEMLTFAVKSDKAPAAIKDHLFSEAVEVEALTEDEPEKPSLLSRVKELLSGKAKTDDARFGQTDAGVIAIAEEVAAIRNDFAGFATSAALAEIAATVAANKAEFSALVEKLSTTDATPPRSPASGGSAHLTDC